MYILSSIDFYRLVGYELRTDQHFCLSCNYESAVYLVFTFQDSCFIPMETQCNIQKTSLLWEDNSNFYQQNVLHGSLCLKRETVKRRIQQLCDFFLYFYYYFNQNNILFWLYSITNHKSQNEERKRETDYYGTGRKTKHGPMNFQQSASWIHTVIVNHSACKRILKIKSEFCLVVIITANKLN